MHRHKGLWVFSKCKLIRGHSCLDNVFKTIYNFHLIKTNILKCALTKVIVWGYANALLHTVHLNTITFLHRALMQAIKVKKD